MNKPCPHCSVPNGPSIKELRRDAVQEANKILREAGIPKAEDGRAYDFDDIMTLAYFLIGLGEDEE